MTDITGLPVAPAWRVTGHESTARALRRSLESPAHSYLLAGPARIGKRIMALEFAKALNCEAGPQDRPCQTCRTCRLISAGIHPDVTMLENEDRERTLIDEVRVVRLALSLRPAEGRWRVVIIRAQPLTDQAHEALLKTLEEPASQVVLILTAEAVDLLPETIVSRCRILAMGLLPAAEIEAHLAGLDVDQARARRLASLSYGAIGWAIAASQDDEMATRREKLRDDLAGFSTAGLLDRLASAERLAGGGGRLDRTRTTVMEELEMMLIWWRDVLLSRTGQAELIVNSGSRRQIESMAQGMTTPRIVQVLQEIALAGTRINQNVDPRLTLEALATGAMYMGTTSTSDA
ncbi:MAG TPA: hypothetical protein VFB34_13445 [Chloroflexota bacterium]|nr:hypothetical protein [Chloroflexota bacterium]